MILEFFTFAYKHTFLAQRVLKVQETFKGHTFVINWIKISQGHFNIIVQAIWEKALIEDWMVIDKLRGRLKLR